MNRLVMVMLLLLSTVAFADPPTTNLSRLEMSARSGVTTDTTFAPVRRTDCTTLRWQFPGSLCFDTDADVDGDGTVGTLYQCSSVSGATNNCSAWEVAGSGLTVPGANGVVLTSNGSGGFTAITRQKIYCGHTDIDTDGDGFIDYMLSSDYDCDGTREGSDVVQAATALQASGTGPVTLELGSGSFAFGYRDQVTITRNGFRLIGQGKDVTSLVINPSVVTTYDACNGAEDFNSDGTIDTLDNGDTTSTIRYMVLMNANNVSVENMTLDGGSPRWRFAFDTKADFTGDGTFDYCDVNDVDRDGTQNPSDVSPGGTCSASAWCPLDSHDIIGSFDGLSNWSNHRLKNLRVLNGDRRAVYRSDNSGPGFSADNIEVDGTGEHALAAHMSGFAVTGSKFTRCAKIGSGCILLAHKSGTARVTIDGNQFSDYAGHAVWLETDTTGSASQNIEKISVTGNVIDADTDPDNDGTANSRTALALGGITLKGTTQSGNTTYVKDGVIGGNVITLVGNNGAWGIEVVSASSSLEGERISLAGNTIYSDSDDLGSSPSGAISIDGNLLTVSANTLDVIGDGTTRRYAVQISPDSNNVQVTANNIRLVGQTITGIYTNSALDVTLSANTVTSNYASGGSGAVYGIYNQDTDNMTIDGGTISGMVTGVTILGASADGLQVIRNLVSQGCVRCVSVDASCDAGSQVYIDGLDCVSNVGYAVDNDSTTTPMFMTGVRVIRPLNASPGWDIATAANAHGEVSYTDIDRDASIDAVTRIATVGSTRRAYNNATNQPQWISAWNACSAAGPTYYPTGCGGSPCFVFDLDCDGTVDAGAAGDMCVLANGLDPDCDGTVTTPICGDVSLDPPDTGADTKSTEATGTLTGVTTTMQCSMSGAATIWADDLVPEPPRASASNTVAMRWYCSGAAACNTIAAQTVRICCQEPD